MPEKDKQPKNDDTSCEDAKRPAEKIAPLPKKIGESPDNLRARSEWFEKRHRQS